MILLSDHHLAFLSKAKMGGEHLGFSSENKSQNNFFNDYTIYLCSLSTGKPTLFLSDNVST